MSRKAPDSPDRFIPGAIISDAMYTSWELCLRLRWNSDDVSLALSTGLKRHVFGGTVYVFGSDVMDFIRSRPEGGDA
jgi:hypothetical protein